MSKRFDAGLDRFQVSELVRAIRSKRDVILLWMRAIKVFLAYQPPADDIRAANLSIVIKSMSRLFCESSDGRKIFSVAFPFVVREEGGQMFIASREGVEIDSRVSSQVVSLIEHEHGGILGAKDFAKFIDPLIESADIDSDLWILMRELMLAEDVYVRYDWDEARADGHRHPVHHLDLGYSGGGTFKLGLEQAIDHAGLFGILDLETDCHYVTPPPQPPRSR